MYTLYGEINVASFAPHVCLIKAGVNFKFINVDMANREQHSEAYLKLNPNGRIPVLIDDSFEGAPLTLYETAAVCLHIADHSPDAGLFPEVGSRERSVAYKWLLYMTNTLQTELLFFHYADRYTSDPAAVPANKKQMALRIQKIIQILADGIDNDFQYFTGDTPNLCDYFLFMLSEWAASFNIEKGPESYPKLMKYLGRVKELPEMQEAFKREGFQPCI